jgi:hypothetical protein
LAEERAQKRLISKSSLAKWWVCFIKLEKQCKSFNVALNTSISILPAL